MFHHRRTLFLVATMASMIVVALLVVKTRRAPVVPPLDHPRPASGISMHDVVFYSQALQREMNYRVFLPENVRNHRLTAVYLLHGGGGSFRDWSNYSDVARFASHDLLLIMPQGDYSYYVNAALQPKDRYEDYIIHDLRVDVEQRFPARTDRAGRAIVGVSMGGFGAINLALHHPDQFVFAGAISPAIDVPLRHFSWKRLDQSIAFRNIFGPDGSATRHANDPFSLVPMTASGAAPFFYITCGREESLLAPNKAMNSLLDRYGFAHEFHEVPGGHEWSRWADQLPDVFDALFRTQAGKVQN